MYLSGIDADYHFDASDALEVVPEQVSQPVVPVGNSAVSSSLLVFTQPLHATSQIHQRVVDLACFFKGLVSVTRSLAPLAASQVNQSQLADHDWLVTVDFTVS